MEPCASSIRGQAWHGQSMVTTTVTLTPTSNHFKVISKLIKHGNVTFIASYISKIYKTVDTTNREDY